MDMTRRAFVAGAVIAAAAAAVPDVPEPTYGLLTVEGWMAYKARTGKELVVLVDGRDVTFDCVRANDRKGYAVVLNKKNGKAYIDLDGQIAREMLRGHVRFIERSA